MPAFFLDSKSNRAERYIAQGPAMLTAVALRAYERAERCQTRRHRWLTFPRATWRHAAPP